jgi:AcrR family transcriptional regulator
MAVPARRQQRLPRAASAGSAQVIMGCPGTPRRFWHSCHFSRKWQVCQFWHNGAVNGASGPGAPGEPVRGRREASKQATRAALRNAAARLFAEQGYQATTVAEIASAAGVGERTFYRYFAGKEELLAERALTWIGALAEAIRQRPAAEAPYQAVARAMAGAVAELAAGAGGAWILSEGTQPLALLRQVTPRPLRRLEQAITGAILDRLAAGPETAPAAQFEAQLVARAAVAALRTAALRYREQAASGGPALDSLLREAFTRLTQLTSPPPFPAGLPR